MEEAGPKTFHHCSHRHPLELTTSPSYGNITCNGCNLRILANKDFYSCRSCSFSLHRVCFNMPRKTKHPSHPSHSLTLLISPPSDNSFLECKACGFSISGFYYNCGDCSIYYHVLCVALPLSIAISPHPHMLKMEFSPPYDFNCDLCLKPSYKGWLYRCRFCEFDVHFSCAISNKKPELLAAPEAMQRQIIKSSASLPDNGSVSSELMQLLVQRVSGGFGEREGQEVLHSAVAGWDQRLHSPKKNLNIEHAALQHPTKPFIPSASSTPGSQTQDHRISPPISEEFTIPSYQFSDFCFSIDLLKSYASENKNAGSKETSCQDIIIVPDADLKHGNVAMSRKSLGDFPRVQRQQLGHPIKPVINPLYRNPENWPDAAPYDEKLGQNDHKSLDHGFGSRSRLTENKKQDNATSKGSSCCWNLFMCCYPSRYEKCIKTSTMEESSC